MAAPTVRTGHQSAFQGSGASIVVNTPTTIDVGDRLVLWLIVEYIGNQSPPTVTPPTGFELAETTSSQSSSFSGHLFRFEKVADGGEGSTLTSTFDVPASYSGALAVALSPCYPGPATEQSNVGASSVMTYPAVTTTVVDSLVLRCGEAQKTPDGTPSGGFTGELWYDGYAWWGHLAVAAIGTVAAADDDLSASADVWNTQTVAYQEDAPPDPDPDPPAGDGPYLLTDAATKRVGAYPGVDGSSGKIVVPSGLQDGDGVLLLLCQYCEHSGDDPGDVYVYEGTSVSDDNDPPGTLLNGNGFVVYAPAAQEPSPIYRPWGTVAWGIAGDGTGGTFDKTVTHWDVKWAPSPSTYPDGLPDTAVDLYALPVRSRNGGALAVDQWTVTSDQPTTPGAIFTAAELTTTKPDCLVVTAYGEGWEQPTDYDLTGYTLVESWQDGYNAIWQKDQPTAGATGAPTLDINSGDHGTVSYIAITVAVYEQEVVSTASLGVDVAVSATAVKRAAAAGTLTVGLATSGGGPKAAATAATLDLDVAIDAAAVMHAVTAATLGVALDIEAAAGKVAQTAAELGVALTVDAAAGKVAAAAVSLGLDITTSGTAIKTAATEAVLGVALDLAADSAKTAAVAASLGIDLAIAASAVKNEPGHASVALALALACIAAAVKRAAASATLGIDLGVAASAVKNAAATADLDVALGIGATASTPDVPHVTATFGLALTLTAAASKHGQTVSTLALLVALTAAVPSGIIRVLAVGRPVVTVPVGDATIGTASIGPPIITTPVGPPEVT